MSVRFCISCKRNKSFSIFFRYLNIPFVFLLCVFSFVIAQTDESVPAVETQTTPSESITPPVEVPQTPSEPTSSNQDNPPAIPSVTSPTTIEVQKPSDSAPVSSIEVELVPTVVPSDPDSPISSTPESTDAP